jgi:hypothetical protein
MGLRPEAPRHQTRTVGLDFQRLHALQQPFQFPQHLPFQGLAALAVPWHRLHVLECPFPASLVDGFPQARWTTEVTMRQQFDLPHA